MLILSGDIEVNPGPTTSRKDIWPCGLCQLPVTWTEAGVACDECSVWHHMSCISLCTKDREDLERSSVQWLCCKCDNINCDSFTFRSYETQTSNFFEPLSCLDSTLDSVFSPLHTSSPKDFRNLVTSKSAATLSTNRSKTKSGSGHSNVFEKLPAKQNLRIMTINCRSLKENNAEFKASINYIKPDIICGTESWLRGIKPGKNPTHDAIKNSEIFPENYNIYRNDRSSRGGGVFIAVQSNITSVECTDSITNCEIETVKISLKGRRDLYISSFYMAKRNLSDLDQLRSALNTSVNSQNKQHILCGDFNCPNVNWETLTVPNDPATQDRAVQQKLVEISIESGLTQVHEQPTRQGNILDLVFVSNPSLVKSSVSVPGISDHDIVVTDLDIRPIYSNTKPRRIYMFGRADWDSLKTLCRKISDKVLSLPENENLESAWNFFKSEIHSAVDKCVPSKMVKKRHSLPWLNRDLKRSTRRKARYYKQAKKTGNWSKYRNFQKECKNAFRKAEWNYVNNTIQKGLDNKNSKPFWNYVKSKNQENMGISPLKKKGNLVTDSKSKANILVDQFQSVFCKTKGIANESKLKYAKNSIPSIETLKITDKGVLKLLLELNVSKAMGPDQIPNIVLRKCAHELVPAIAKMFQASVDSGSLPSDWRNANISPVFKKGDRHLAENYRPVSLTTVLCKLLEHIICGHLLKHLEKHSILTDRNHGFRSGYSTETQLLITMNDLLKLYDNKCQVDVAILDFSKAFDTVPHDKLLQKLENYGVRGNLLVWLSAFLKNRNMNVVVEGEHSVSVSVESGVPQGTVLGPLMFLCHINDLPDSVKSTVRLFADDCLLYHPIRSDKEHLVLQNDLHELEKWADLWGMKFNAKKCYILSVRQKSTFFYELDQTILQQVNSNPYLGVTLSDDLTWETHINNICKKANSTLGFLKRNLRNCAQDCRKLAYISLVRSSLEYGSIVWDPYYAKDINSLEKIQRHAARFITKDYASREDGCVTRMLQNLRLDTLQQRRQQARLIFIFKIIRGMVPAIDKSCFLTPLKNKRRIKPKVIEDSININVVEKFSQNHSDCYKIPQANSIQYRHSFFVKAVQDWNRLPSETACADTVEGFKTALTQRD